MAGKSGSSYMVLFNAIAAQEVYDEEKLKITLRREKFIKHLPVIKSQLYDLVLRILRFPQTDTSTQARIYAALDSADLLFARSLFDAAFQELSNARKLCEEAGYENELLLVLSRERRFNSIVTTENFKELMTGFDAEGRRLLNIIRKHHDLHDLYYKILFFTRSERFVRTPEHAAYLDTLMEQAAAYEPFEEFGFRGKITYLMFRKIYWQLKGNDEKALDYMHRVVQLYNLKPAAIEAEPILYVNALTNLLNALIPLKRTKEVEPYISTVNVKMLEGNPVAMGTYAWLKANYIISAYQLSNRFEELADLGPELLNEIDRYKSHITPVRHTMIMFNLTLVYLYNARYNEMLELINRILNEKEDKINREFLAHARIYQLIVHYHLGNMLLLESISRSTKHFLQTREHFYETEKVAVNHFARIATATDKNALKQRFIELRDDLKATARTNNLEEKFQTQTLLHIWLESRITGVSMLQLHRQKLNA